MAEIQMPRLSDTMEEGTIARWVKQPGDPVAPGDVLAEIETDKATMDLEAYEGGVLQEILLPEGATAPIGQVVAIVAPPGSPPGGTSSAGATASRPEEAPRPGPATGSPATGSPAERGPAGSQALRPPAAPAVSANGTPRPLRSSPLARAVARRAGLDLSLVTGSGPGGRIVRADVEEALAHLGPSGDAATPAPAVPAASAAPPSGPGPSPAPGALGPVAARLPDDEVIPLGSIRRLTAERMTESARTPHFHLSTSVDVTELVALRREVNAHLAAEGAKVSVTDLLVAAVARVLARHPEVNASFGGDAILRHRRIHVGVAVAVDDGLVVPVVHDADRASLTEIARRAHDLAERARQRRLTPDDLQGGTFTISNLGMYGVAHFSAVLNPPQAAILAVGAAIDQPVARDGQVVVRPMMELTLGIDHRVLDGARGAEFLADLRATLETPLRILL